MLLSLNFACVNAISVTHGDQRYVCPTWWDEFSKKTVTSLLGWSCWTIDGVEIRNRTCMLGGKLGSLMVIDFEQPRSDTCVSFIVCLSAYRLLTHVGLILAWTFVNWLTTSSLYAEARVLIKRLPTFIFRFKIKYSFVSKATTCRIETLMLCSFTVLQPLSYTWRHSLRWLWPF